MESFCDDLINFHNVMHGTEKHIVLTGANTDILHLDCMLIILKEQLPIHKKV